MWPDAGAGATYRSNTGFWVPLHHWCDCAAAVFFSPCPPQCQCANSCSIWPTIVVPLIQAVIKTWIMRILFKPFVQTKLLKDARTYIQMKPKSYTQIMPGVQHNPPAYETENSQLRNCKPNSIILYVYDLNRAAQNKHI